MNLEEASVIIGSQPRVCVTNMHRALGFCPWLNTDDDWKRRSAAELVLKHWNAHTKAVQSRLDARRR